MAEAGRPLEVAGGCEVAACVVVVVAGAELVVVPTAALLVVARKATTSVEPAASNKPSPIDGVGKWLAGAPTTACSATAPVVGLSPYRVPF